MPAAARASRSRYSVYSPLAGGWLTGKYRRGESFPAGSRMTQRPEGYAAFVDERDLRRARARSRRARASAASRWPALALSWLLAQPASSPRSSSGRCARSTSSRCARRSSTRSTRRRSATRSAGLFADERADPLRGARSPSTCRWRECIEAMEAVLAARARGEARCRCARCMRGDGLGRDARPDARLPRRRRTPLYSLKAVCVFPPNPRLGLDAHQGIVTLFDGETGRPTAVLNGSAVTSIRTAAVTALATRAARARGRADARDHRRRRPGAGPPARAACSCGRFERVADLRAAPPSTRAALAERAAPSTARRPRFEVAGERARGARRRRRRRHRDQLARRP